MIIAVTAVDDVDPCVAGRNRPEEIHAVAGPDRVAAIVAEDVVVAAEIIVDVFLDGVVAGTTGNRIVAGSAFDGVVSSPP